MTNTERQSYAVKVPPNGQRLVLDLAATGAIIENVASASVVLRDGITATTLSGGSTVQVEKKLNRRLIAYGQEGNATLLVDATVDVRGEYVYDFKDYSFPFSIIPERGYIDGHYINVSGGSAPHYAAYNLVDRTLTEFTPTNAPGDDEAVYDTIAGLGQFIQRTSAGWERINPSEQTETTLATPSGDAKPDIIDVPGYQFYVGLQDNNIRFWDPDFNLVWEDGNDPGFSASGPQRQAPGYYIRITSGYDNLIIYDLNAQTRTVTSIPEFTAGLIIHDAVVFSEHDLGEGYYKVDLNTGEYELIPFPTGPTSETVSKSYFQGWYGIDMDRPDGQHLFIEPLTGRQQLARPVQDNTRYTLLSAFANTGGMRYRSPLTGKLRYWTGNPVENQFGATTWRVTQYSPEFEVLLGNYWNHDWPVIDLSVRYDPSA